MANKNPVDSDWAEGCLNMIEDVLKGLPCMHGEAPGDGNSNPPMFYNDWIGCVVARARKDGGEAADAKYARLRRLSRKAVGLLANMGSVEDDLSVALRVALAELGVG